MCGWCHVHLFCRLSPPWGTDEAQQEEVQTDITSDLPGQNDADCDDEEHRIAACTAGHHKVPVHQRTEEGGDTCKGTHNQADTDEQLAIGNQRSHVGVGIAIDQHLQKATIPIKGNGWTTYFGTYTFLPTDSDLGQGITDFGRFMAWSYVSPTWFSNGSPGGGYLHVPVAPVTTAQANAINTKLGTSQFVVNGPVNPARPRGR